MSRPVLTIESINRFFCSSSYSLIITCIIISGQFDLVTSTVNSTLELGPSG